MAETNKQKLNRLYKEHNLSSDDTFKHRLGFSIITRTGIEKIQAGMGLSVVYDLISLSDDHKNVVIKARGTMQDTIIESYGEASPENNRMGYPIAMAEKRALSRVVLKASGFYALGVYGEDEADEFRERPSKKPVTAPVEQPKQETAPTSTMDETLDAIKLKLEGGTANPIQVRDWLTSKKGEMTDAQIARATEIIKPYM